MSFSTRMGHLLCLQQARHGWLLPHTHTRCEREHSPVEQDSCRMAYAPPCSPSCCQPSRCWCIGPPRTHFAESGPLRPCSIVATWYNRGCVTETLFPPAATFPGGA